jgi:hypothetical protein
MRLVTLYGGEVTVEFDPDARFRYKITDPVMGLDHARVRGVTTVLGDILDKPGLRFWPRDEALKAAFGMKSVNDKPKYNAMDALIQPNAEYEETELQNILEQSFNACNVKSDRGKDIGTMTHDFCAQYLAGGLTGIGKDKILAIYPNAPYEFMKCVIKAVNSFVGWWTWLKANHEVEFLGSENLIYSRIYRFSGTYDLKVKIDGQLYMLDIKTTNRSQNNPLGVYPEYFTQLGGYMAADSEESGDRFDDCGIVNVGKDGKLNIVTSGDMGVSVKDCMSSFKTGVQLHNWLEGVKPLLADSHFVSSLVDSDRSIPKVINKRKDKIKERIINNGKVK